MAPSVIARTPSGFTAMPQSTAATTRRTWTVPSIIHGDFGNLGTAGFPGRQAMPRPWPFGKGFPSLHFSQPTPIPSADAPSSAMPVSRSMRN